MNDYMEKRNDPPGDDIDSWLREKEASVPDLVPGTEKKIVWHRKAGTKTPFALIYIHGFGSSRQETSPVFDRVAERIGANLFYTRLRGHGRTAEAMMEPKLADWQNDALEARRIGELIGNRMIIVGMSTGAPLAVWLSTQMNSSNIAALVLPSPNFGPANRAAGLLLLPGGSLIARIIVGKYHAFEPMNELHNKYWTNPCRSESLKTMMRCVRLGQKLSLESVFLPVLCVYTENDRTLSIPAIHRMYERLGSGMKKLVNLKAARDHGLAGDIVSPETTDALVDEVLAFLMDVVPGIGGAPGLEISR